MADGCPRIVRRRQELLPIPNSDPGDRFLAGQKLLTNICNRIVTQYASPLGYIIPARLAFRCLGRSHSVLDLLRAGTRPGPGKLRGRFRYRARRFPSTANPAAGASGRRAQGTPPSHVSAHSRGFQPLRFAFGWEYALERPSAAEQFAKNRERMRYRRAALQRCVRLHKHQGFSPRVAELRAHPSSSEAGE